MKQINGSSASVALPPVGNTQSAERKASEGQEGRTWPCCHCSGMLVSLLFSVFGQW